MTQADLPTPAGRAPRVSVIVPVRNEAATIGATLDGVLGQDYPPGRLEVLVVDGESDDGTRRILQERLRGHATARLLSNPRRVTPAALNLGIRAATGEVLVRMDGHTEYPRHYVSTLVRWLERSGADNVGGVIRTVPGGPGPVAEGIAAALSHPFGIGNSHFRIGTRAPRWVDTVPFGCYRREVFDRIGLFAEDLVRNQDDELNLRLIRHGGRILLVPEVESVYRGRDSLRKLGRMYYQYGYFKPLVALKLGRVMTLRQLAPPLFVLLLSTLLLASPWSRVAGALAAAVGLVYAAAVLAAALWPGRRPASLRAAAALALAFPVLHLSYGAGFLHGALALLLRRGGQASDPLAVPLTR